MKASQRALILSHLKRGRMITPLDEGFQAGDWVVCPSGRYAQLVRLRRDDRFDATYRNGDSTILDPRQLQHADVEEN